MKRAFDRNNSRQRPTLPHTYACSTIGGGRLNFRVRNGNGWDPAPMTTGKLAAWGLRLRASPALRRTSRHGLPDVARVASEVGVVPDNVKEPTEYPANGSSPLPSQLKEEKQKMVKPHGLLVPVSLTSRDASTPGLSTWSSTRSLQRSCDLGDLISWRVSRL